MQPTNSQTRAAAVNPQSPRIIEVCRFHAASTAANFPPTMCAAFWCSESLRDAATPLVGFSLNNRVAIITREIESDRPRHRGDVCRTRAHIGLAARSRDGETRRAFPAPAAP
jgi:hypothetical protein